MISFALLFERLKINYSHGHMREIVVYRKREIIHGTTVDIFRLKTQKRNCNNNKKKTVAI